MDSAGLTVTKLPCGRDSGHRKKITGAVVARGIILVAACLTMLAGIGSARALDCGYVPPHDSLGSYGVNDDKRRRNFDENSA